MLRSVPFALAIAGLSASLAAAQPASQEAAPASPPAATPPPPRAAVETVEIAAIVAPDLFSVSGGETGLAPTLWRGSSPEIAKEVIPTLGARPLSPPGLALARRLMATGAIGPDGAGNDPDLAGARAAALLAAGDPAGAASLLERTAIVSDSPALSRAAADAALTLGQPDRACLAADALKTARDQPYWLRLRAYCLAHANKTAEAQLAFRLATPAATTPTDAYARLMEARMVEGAPAGEASARSPIELALSRDLNLDLAPAIATATPAALRVLAIDPAAGPAVNLAAGRAALRQGLITGEAARAADPEAALEFSARPGPTFTSQTVATRLSRAKGPAEFTATARLLAEGIAKLPPKELAPETRITLASAAAAAGDLPTAREIRDAIERTVDAPALDLALLDALLAAAAGQADTPVIDHLLERSGIGDARARARAAGGAALLIALADPKAEALGGRDRAELSRLDIGAIQAPAARLMAMDLAADSGLAGETGLLALSVAASGGAAGPRLADRIAIVRALARAGLRQDAAAFAVEGILELQGR